MSGETSPSRVLLVEDDASLREGMMELVSEQAPVLEAGSVAEALAALEGELFCLVMTDLRIGQKGEGGRIILEAARRRLQPVVIVSASSADEVGRVLHPHVPDAVLRKPFQLEDMLSLVERFVRLHQEVRRVAAEGVPTEGWRPVAEGLSTCEASGGAQWWRMAPGCRSSPAQPGQGLGMVLVEGALEVEGERRVGSQYFFLTAGARAVSAPAGCLAVSLALRA